jgi:hypothetical protein
MSGALSRAGLALWVALAGPAAHAQSLLVQAQPGEVLIGPLPVQETVVGVPLLLHASGFFRFASVGEQLQVQARIVADLSELQSKIGSLLSSVQLPSDGCGFAVSISSEQLLASGRQAVLRLHGDATLSWCGPFGTRGQIGKQPFDADLPFTLVVADPRTLAVDPERPNVTLGGPLAGATDLLLRLFGVDIDAKAQSAFDASSLGDRLKVTIPEDLRSLDLAIAGADFASDGGALAATVQVGAALDAQALAALVQAIMAAG